MQIDPRLKEISDCLYRLAIKAVIVNDRKILLVREQDDEWWSLPGGGIDHGEDIQQALARELLEELGVGQDAIRADYKVLFVTVGALVDGIPKANLFYRVEVPAADIKKTKHVTEYSWFTADELPDLDLSPSTGRIIKQLPEIINQQY
jgi:8-oxo-dGTP diphosphatase